MAQRGASFAKGLFTSASRTMDELMREKLLERREQRREEREKDKEQREADRKKAERAINTLLTLGVTVEDLFPELRQPPAEQGGGPPTPAIEPTTGKRVLGLEMPPGGGPLTQLQAAEAKRAAEEDEARGLETFKEKRRFEIAHPLPEKGAALDELKLKLQKARAINDFSAQALEEYKSLSDEQQKSTSVDKYVAKRVADMLVAAGIEAEGYAEPQPSEIVEQHYIDEITRAVTAADARASIERIASAPLAPPVSDHVKQVFKDRFGVDYDVPGMVSFGMGVGRFVQGLERTTPFGFTSQFITESMRNLRTMTLGQAMNQALQATVPGQWAQKLKGAIDIAKAQTRTVPELLAQQEATDLVETAKNDANVLLKSGNPDYVGLANAFLNDEMTIDEFYVRFPAGYGSAAAPTTP